MERNVKPSNIDLVLAVLLELGGDEEYVHTEVVALRSHERFPGRFCWTLPKYKDIPDKEPVRVALEDAKKTKNFYMGGPLVSGRAGKAGMGRGPDGWQLTGSGLAYLRSIRAALEQYDLREPALGRRVKDDLQRMVERSEAWRRFVRGGHLHEASEVEVRDLIRYPRSASDEGFREAFRVFVLKLRKSTTKPIAALAHALEEWEQERK